MEVPDYLAAEFRMLEDTGYQLREEYGSSLRKYIKYDPAVLGLYLEVKFPGEKRWTNVTPRLAREIVEFGNRQVAEGIRNRMRRRSTERGANLLKAPPLLSVTRRSDPSPSPNPIPIKTTNTTRPAIRHSPHDAPIQKAIERHDSAMSGVEESAPLIDLATPSPGTSAILGARHAASTSTPVPESKGTTNKRTPSPALQLLTQAARPSPAADQLTVDRRTIRPNHTRNKETSASTSALDNLRSACPADTWSPIARP